MSLYIGYRNLPEYWRENNLAGGTPENPDQRLMECKSGVYLLIFGGQNYAVSKERAEKFTAEVLSKCTEKHRGYFPTDMTTSYNGKQFAAVVEVNEGYLQYHYDMDEEVLLQMLTELKDECGSPLDRRGTINHCYPNAVLPEGDFELKSICHKIFIYDNTPVSVICSHVPDKMTSIFWIYEDQAHVEIREENLLKKYDVPEELIPEIKSKVRQLCSDPAEAYVENGVWESYVDFGEDGEEKIYTKPDETYELLKEIASKSVLKETEEKESDGRNPVSGGMGFGMMGVMGINNLQMQMEVQQAAAATAPAPAPQENKGNFCMICGTPRNGNKYCSNCGAEFN